MPKTSAVKPTISIIVPVFNEKPSVLYKSLVSIAEQSYSDFECLLIDDSTDADSRAFASAFCAEDVRFRHIIPRQRLGLAASLNLAIGRSKSDLIARFDSDDVCMPQRLELQIKALQKDPKVDVLGGALELIDDHDCILAYRNYPSTHEQIMRAMQFTTAIAHPTVMIRKSALLRVGGYDPSFRYAEDLDLWLRLANQNFRFANLPNVLVRYRQNNVRRSSDHWRYNFRARQKNFSGRYFFRRSAGTLAIGLWSKLPRAVQEFIYHKALLHERQRR